MLLGMARVPIIRIQLREMAAGIIEAVNAPLIWRKPSAFRLGPVHRVHELGCEHCFSTLLTLLIHLRAIFDNIDQRLVIAHSRIDGNLVPEWAVDAFPGTQLRAEIVLARGVAIDEVAGKDQQVRRMACHLCGEGSSGNSVDALERRIAAAQATRTAVAGEDE